MDLLDTLDGSVFGTGDDFDFAPGSPGIYTPDGSPFLPYGELLSPVPEPDFGGAEFLELLPNDSPGLLETDFLATMSPKEIEKTIAEKPYCATEELLGALSDYQLHKLFKQEPLLINVCSEEFWRRRCEIKFPLLFEFAKDLDMEFKWCKLYSESCLIPQTMPFEVTLPMLNYPPLIRFLSTLDCNLTDFVFNISLNNSKRMKKVLDSGAELRNASAHLDFCTKSGRFALVKVCAKYGYYPSASTLITMCLESFPKIPVLIMHFFVFGAEPKTDVMDFWSEEHTGRLIFRQLVENNPEIVVNSETTGQIVNIYKGIDIPDHFVRHYSSVNDSEICEMIESHRNVCLRYVVP